MQTMGDKAAFTLTAGRPQGHLGPAQQAGRRMALPQPSSTKNRGRFPQPTRAAGTSGASCPQRTSAATIKTIKGPGARRRWLPLAPGRAIGSQMGENTDQQMLLRRA